MSTDPGYRYPQELVDDVADRIVKAAGGFHETNWTEDPRDTAQAAFDAFLRHITPEEASA